MYVFVGIRENKYVDILWSILENIGIFQNFDLLKKGLFSAVVIFGIFFEFGDRVPSKWMSPIDTIMKKQTSEHL